MGDILRKKVIGLTLAGVVALSGVVSAASWGKFKGNEIVQVKVENKVLNFGTTRTPAIIYNGSVMIPLYYLRTIGVNYEYDTAKKIATFQNESKRNVELKNKVRTVKDEVLNLYLYLDVYRELEDFKNSILLFNQANTFFKISSGTQRDQMLASLQSGYKSLESSYNRLITLTNQRKSSIPKTNLRIKSYDDILDNYQLGLDKMNEYLEKASASSIDDKLYNESAEYFSQGWLDASRAASNLKTYVATYNPAP